MTGSRLALVADDQRLAGATQTVLKKALGHPVFQCTFGAIRTYLSRDTDGGLLLAVNSAADAQQALLLVQEIYLQKMPSIIFLLEGPELLPGTDLRRLGSYVAGRFSWPFTPHSRRPPVVTKTSLKKFREEAIGRKTVGLSDRI